MALFGRNKDEDEDGEYEDEDELIEEERQDRKLTRKFKDLKRENRKKRKEPPKPWGKKERLTILIIIISTVLIAGILAVSNQAHITFNFAKPSFSFDFSKLNPFKEETITIQKK
jgi:hypothetical protein